MPDWLWRLLFAALIVQIPFEFRYKLLGLSNLQWTFAALAFASVPLLIRNRKDLIRDRLLQAAAVFVGVQWIAVLLAPEFHTNALKAAVRFTAGFALLAIVRVAASEKLATKVWFIASSLAAAYALIEYAGLGFPQLFRTGEFYIGQILRLSGSFEYPNTAAAYFAMSLPIVWWSSFGVFRRLVVAFLLWSAIILTFSKGALIAVPAVAIFAGIKQWRSAALLLATGLAAYIVLLPLNPYLIERIYGPAARNPISAQYTASWNDLKEQPGENDMVPLTIRNTGVSTWRASGLWRASIGTRWWNMDEQRFMTLTPVVTALPRNVAHDETVSLRAGFQTPDGPGRYLLVIELFSRNFDWFSRTGVFPLLIQTDIRPGLERTTGISDMSAWNRRGGRPDVLTADVSRSRLWTAALKMFRGHPFGVGPDNYRLEYGKYLGATRWDTHIYSNSVYLELLAGSGFLGLIAFLIMVKSRAWSADPPSLSTGVFLIHGIVDVFLMTTPIYFAFWIVLGWRSHASES